MEIVEQVLLWIVNEIVAFGGHWAVVGVVMLGFGGFFGRRWRNTKKRLAILEESEKQNAAALEESEKQNASLKRRLSALETKVGEKPETYLPWNGNPSYPNVWVNGDRAFFSTTKGTLSVSLADGKTTTVDIARWLDAHGLL